MKISGIEVVFVHSYLYVKVTTDEGIIGVGESGAWGYQQACSKVVEAFTPNLIGMDPLRIEHIWQYMYRCYHFRGAAIMGAISAIDIALWDIAGKYFNAPIYQLLGGKTRNKARCYFHVRGPSTDQIVSACKAAKDAGFSAVGHLSPFLDISRSEKQVFETYAQKIDRAVERVSEYRKAVGNEVDLCLEIHRRLKPAEAIDIASELKQFRPMFFEDPTTPDNINTMQYIANKIDIPVATGERLHTIQEFQMLLASQAIAFVRTSIGLCGGISGAKKISALAEATGVGVVPHNPEIVGPIALAACLQLDASISNFVIQELPVEPSSHNYRESVKIPIEREGAFLIIPDRPGHGMELSDNITERLPPISRDYVTRIHEDGSVYDD